MRDIALYWAMGMTTLGGLAIGILLWMIVTDFLDDRRRRDRR